MNGDFHFLRPGFHPGGVEVVQDDGPGPGGQSREADVHQGTRYAGFPDLQDSFAAGLYLSVHPDDTAPRDYLQVPGLGDISRRLGQDHIQGRGPGSRDGALVCGILCRRSGRDEAGHALLQVIGRLEPYIARGDAVFTGRVRHGFHGKPAGGVARGGNILLGQIRHEIQVYAFSGHDGRRFRPGELEEMRRGGRVIRPGQDDLDGLEQVPDNVEVRAHVRLSQVNGVAQVQVFSA